MINDFGDEIKNYQEAINKLRPANVKTLDGLELVVVSHSDYINIYIHHNNFIISDVSYKDDDGKIKTYYEISDHKGEVLTLYGGTRYTKSNLKKSLGLDPLKLIHSGDLAQLVKIDGIEEVKIYNVKEIEDQTITVRETYHSRNPDDYYSAYRKLEPTDKEHFEILEKVNALYILELAHIQHETIVELNDEEFTEMLRDFNVDAQQAFYHLDGYTSDELEHLYHSNTDTSFKKEFLDILEGYAEIFAQEKLSNIKAINDKTQELIIKQQPLIKGNLNIITDKLTRSMFYKTFTQSELLSGEVSYPVNVKGINGEIIVVPATIKLKENLTPFQYYVKCAILTIHKNNPDAKSIPVMEIIRTMYNSPHGIKIRRTSKIYEQTIKAIDALRTVDYEFDITAQIENKKGKMLEVSQVLTDNLLSAKRKKVSVNGQSVDAIILKGSFEDDPLNRYIIDTGQLFELPPELCLNPLTASEDNINIHHYLANKINNMPLGHGGLYFAKKRLKLNEDIRERQDKWLRSRKKLQDKYTELENEIIEIDKQIKQKPTSTFKDAKKERLQSERSRKKIRLDEIKKELDDLDLKITGKDKNALKDLTNPLIEQEKKIQIKDRTIRLDTLEKELGLKIQRSKLADRVEEVLNLFIKTGAIKSYTVRKKKVQGGEKRKEAYIIKYF